MILKTGPRNDFAPEAIISSPGAQDDPEMDPEIELKMGPKINSKMGSPGPAPGKPFRTKKVLFQSKSLVLGLSKRGPGNFDFGLIFGSDFGLIFDVRIHHAG